MSRHVVPAIVFVTLTIMFGSSLLAQRRGAQLRQPASSETELARWSNAPVTVPQAPPPK